MSIITRGQTPENDALIEQIISDNSDPDLLGTLTDQEQMLYVREIEKIRQGTYTDEDATRLDLADYARQPPTMTQFMEDDYYLGRALRHTEENEGIFPEWKRVLTHDFDRDSKIHNLVITGSLGIGKSWIAVTLLLYRMVCATCLRNPQNFFGLSSGSEMYYLILSVTKEQVKDTAFGDAMNFMAQSAFFVEECKYDPDSQYSRYRIPIRCRLPSGIEANITLIAGSKGQHAIGRNIVAVLLDEGNFRLEENPDLKAYQLYDNVRTRIINRFQKRSGFLPAISLIASSASDESSFTEKIIKEIEEVNDPKTQKIYRYPIYKIKRHTLTLKPWWFKVAYGLKNIEPFVLRGLYRETGEPIPQEELHPRPDGTPMPNDSHEAPPPGARTELVPGDYYEAFRRNARNALQNLAGISVGGSHRLFSSLVDVYWCIQEAEKYLPNPHTKEMVPISSEDNLYLWDYLTHSKFLTIVNSKVQPIRHFQHKRYAHLDFAKSGMAGLAICHLAGNQLITGLVQDGEPYEEYRLIVEYDFIFTIVSGETKDINFEKVLRFFFWLRDTCGYRFGTISADMYQCLEGSTLVNTDHGLVPIKSVQPGWQVHSQSGPNKVNGVVCYEQRPALRITTDRGDVICGTPNHKLWAAPPGRADKAVYRWVRLDELREGWLMGMVREPVTVGAPALYEQEYLLQKTAWPRTYPVGNFTWVPPARMDSPDFAQWLGLYWGDGHACSNGAVRLTVERESVADTKHYLAHYFGAEPAEHASDDGSASLDYYSVNFVRWLAANGFKKAVRKSKKPHGDLAVPEAVLRSPPDIQAAFLRGLFQADGSVDAQGHVCLSTCHLDLAQQVAVMLRTTFGLLASVRSDLREGFGVERMQHQVRLMDSRSRFKKWIGFLFGAKRAALDAVKHQEGRRLVSRVTCVEPLVCDVYDLSVDVDPSYTANGFISHNSVMPLQTLEARGFEVDDLSIDRNKAVYDAWRMGWDERRIRSFKNEQMLREAEQLVDVDKKYDHPPDGSKDTTDACAGAFWNAINSDEKVTLNSVNEAGMYPGQPPATRDEGPPIEIPIQVPRRRTKIFVG